MSAIHRSLVQLEDGRLLEYSENLVPGDCAVLLHHGTPATTLLWDFWLDKFTAAGLRAISYARPGYGGSTRAIGRSLRDGSRDTRALLDNLGVNRFVSVGWSGGGPSAISDALLPECLAAHSIAGLSNYRAQGDSFFNGLPEDNLRELTSYIRSWDDGFAFTASAVSEIHADRDTDKLHYWSERPHFADFKDVYEQLAHSIGPTASDAVQDGGFAMADDLFRIVSNWGFNFDELLAPVHIWQGEMDFSTPPSMGKWLANNIPGAALTMYPDQTHSSIAVERREEIFAKIENALKL